MTEDGADQPVREWARRPGETVVEVPLSCGVAVHGRLRLFTPGGGRSALRPETLRRLATACTMAACALENLRRNAEWAWHGRDEAGEDGRSRLSEAHSTAVARDATFLNAVLPFALSQAKRHREPVSLLCLGIDRLAAIQDLLGPEVADRLVQDVARTVSSSVRSSDIVARLDDDRIVVLLIRARGPSALSVARIIGRAMTETTRNVPELPSTTVSIGVAEFPADVRTRHSLSSTRPTTPWPGPRAGGQTRSSLAQAQPIRPAPRVRVPDSRLGPPRAPAERSWPGIARGLAYQSTTEPSSASYASRFFQSCPILSAMAFSSSSMPRPGPVGRSR